MKNQRIEGWTRLRTFGALTLAGCSGAVQEPTYLRSGDVTDLSHVDLSKQPIIIELHEGDVIPLDVIVAGDLIASPEGASIPLTAKKPFFIRVDNQGLK